MAIERMITPARERGAALLTVLLLVAVIAVLAATALEKLRLSTRLASNMIAIEQARGYAMAAETLATTRIDSLLSRNPAQVTLAGGWSGRPFQLPVPGGVASATVVDGGNCFNLNGLAVNGGPGVLVARPAAIVQFTRLMTLLGIPGQPAAIIAASTADWIDSDSNPLPNGAEDERYGNRRVSYRTGNTLISDISELRAIAEVTPQIYAKLRPWVCAQPRAEPSKINVNTLLPEQAALFAMLLPDTLTIDQARALLLERPAQGYTSTDAFWKLPALRGIIVFPEGQAQTAVTTRWFALRIEVELGGSELTESALIDASVQPARLVSRAWGDPA
ncbi:type II secretion system minor pseudopilin GspK [Sphingomonas sp. 28-62-11]|uniref:type II secretion system minor pseudopilin GspK n=1 Tax=Sphingomonas sp. 28-62-11 TaxID=1970432 RepID=UPI0035A8405A